MLTEHVHHSLCCSFSQTSYPVSIIQSHMYIRVKTNTKWEILFQMWYTLKIIFYLLSTSSKTTSAMKHWSVNFGPMKLHPPPKKKNKNKFFCFIQDLQEEGPVHPRDRTADIDCIHGWLRNAQECLLFFFFKKVNSTNSPFHVFRKHNPIISLLTWILLSHPGRACRYRVQITFINHRYLSYLTVLYDVIYRGSSTAMMASDSFCQQPVLELHAHSYLPY